MCNFMYLMHWKFEKNRNEPNELAELKYSKSLTQMTSYAHWYVLLFACSDMYQNIYLFIPFKIRKKDWAKWARILKNTLTDEQLCSLTCFIVFACLNIYKNIYSFITFEIRKNDWAKWAKWARILKNTLTDEQLCS